MPISTPQTWLTRTRLAGTRTQEIRISRCTEALMFANGFTAELLIELVRAGDASAHAERMVAGGRSHEVAT